MPRPRVEAALRPREVRRPPVPSEHLALTWSDIGWERGRIRVTSPKTAHYEGRGERTIPLFPELRPLLEEAFEAAPEGSRYVIARWRDTQTNRRTHLLRIIRRAGLKPWPKLFHNLRARRQTELAAEYPLHVVCEWIGNTRAVAQEHYLRVTDADFERAAGATRAAAEANGPKEAAQIPAQCTAAYSGYGPQASNEANEKTPGAAGGCDDRRKPARPSNGRGRIRTCDFHRVKMAL